MSKSRQRVKWKYVDAHQKNEKIWEKFKVNTAVQLMKLKSEPFEQKLG